MQRLRLSQLMQPVAALCPLDIGRVALKFKAGSNLKAEEWINFTLYLSELSMVVLGFITEEKLRNWGYFVKFLRLMLLRFITVKQLEDAQQLLLEFLKGFKRLFTAWNVVPNMHVVVHLVEFCLDIGPAMFFSAFPYVQSVLMCFLCVRNRNNFTRHPVERSLVYLCEFKSRFRVQFPITNLVFEFEKSELRT